MQEAIADWSARCHVHIPDRWLAERSTESIKWPTRQRCLQLAWGGLGERTDRPKPMEDY